MRESSITHPAAIEADCPMTELVTTEPMIYKTTAVLDAAGSTANRMSALVCA